MDNKEIAKGKIGEVGEYDVEFKDGKLVAIAAVSKEATAGVALKADVSIEISARAVLEALKKAIPGTIDDAVLELAAKALGI